MSTSPTITPCIKATPGEDSVGIEGLQLCSGSAIIVDTVPCLPLSSTIAWSAAIVSTHIALPKLVHRLSALKESEMILLGPPIRWGM